MPANNFPFDDTAALSSRTAEGSIAYYVDLKSMKSRASYDAQSFTVMVYSQFEPYKFTRAMLGTQKVVTEDGKKQLTRTLPEKLPFPSDVDGEEPKFWCQSCDLAMTFMNGLTGAGRREEWLKPQPDPAANGWPRAMWAGYECVFTAIPADIIDDDGVTLEGLDGDGYRAEWKRYVIVDDEPHAELERVPAGLVVYEKGDGTAVYAPDNTAARRTGYVRRAVTWLAVPEVPPEANYAACSMRVNDAEFMGFDAQKVLFVTRKVRPKTNLIGDRLYDIQCEFLVRDDVGWNQFRDKNNTLRPLRVMVDGNCAAPVYRADPPFPLANLGKLFRFE